MSFRAGLTSSASCGTRRGEGVKSLGIHRDGHKKKDDFALQEMAKTQKRRIEWGISRRYVH